MAKNKLGRKGFILAYMLSSITKGNQGRSSRQEPEAETTEEYCLLACFLSYLSYTAQVSQPHPHINEQLRK